MEIKVFYFIHQMTPLKSLSLFQEKHGTCDLSIYNVYVNICHYSDEKQKDMYIVVCKQFQQFHFKYFIEAEKENRHILYGTEELKMAKPIHSLKLDSGRQHDICLMTRVFNKNILYLISGLFKQESQIYKHEEFLSTYF